MESHSKNKEKTIEEQEEKHVEAVQSLAVNNQQIHPYQRQRSIEDIFSKDLLNQEAINELEKLLETERTNAEDLPYKTDDTKTDRMYDFRKNKIMQSFEWALSNGASSLDNAVNVENFKKSTTSEIEKNKHVKI